MRRGAELGHARSLRGQSIALIERLSHATEGGSSKDRKRKKVLRLHAKGRYNPAFRGRGRMRLPAFMRWMQKPVRSSFLGSSIPGRSIVQLFSLLRKSSGFRGVVCLGSSGPLWLQVELS